MKKLVVSFSFLLVISASYSQENSPARTLTEQDYLQKSKSQKTAAWILLGAGATMIAIVAPGDISLDIVPVLAVGGTAAVIGSIPFFIAAGKNKRRAMTMTAELNIQQTPVILYTAVSKRSHPGISVKLNF
jgi:hypothetical protein